MRLVGAAFAPLFGLLVAAGCGGSAEPSSVDGGSPGVDASADATKKLPSSDGGSPGVDASADATMLSSDGMSVVGPCGPATCRGC